MRTINRIYIHHSASSPQDTVEDIRHWHVEERGWKDIGYHYVITSDGVLHNGRPVEQVGAHVQGDNATSIGICVVGDFDICEPTLEQIASLEWFIPQLCHEFGVTWRNVLGHKDYPGVKKTCPGKYLYAMLPRIRTEIR